MPTPMDNLAALHLDALIQIDSSTLPGGSAPVSSDQKFRSATYIVCAQIIAEAIQAAGESAGPYEPRDGD